MAREHTSTRVNFKRLPDYIGLTVRLTCKVLRFQDNTKAIVETCDGGQVEIQLIPQDEGEGIRETYVEVIGQVQSPTLIKMMAVINLGPELDMDIVNNVVELSHDQRFYDRIFSPN